ncbi:CoA transferase, partial [Brevibacterium paucivorans]
MKNSLQDITVLDLSRVLAGPWCGSLARLGLDYDTLREINPELIWVSITGYGPTGPKAENPGYDYVFQGMSGFMSYTGRAKGEEGAGPIRAGVAII